MNVDSGDIRRTRQGVGEEAARMPLVEEYMLETTKLAGERMENVNSLLSINKLIFFCL